VSVGIHFGTLSGERIQQYLENWLEAIKPNTRPNTFASCRRAAAKYSELLGNILLNKLTGLHIQQAVNSESNKGVLAPSTILLHLTKFRVALTQAVDWGIIPKSPAVRIKSPECEKPVIEFWEENEARLFLSVAEKYRYFSLFWVVLHTGMRIGELLGLTWEDVDMENELAYVRRTATQFGVNAPKSASSKRGIPLDPGTIKVIRKHRKQMMEESFARGQGWTEKHYVFVSRNGKRLTNSGIKGCFRCAIKRAGVKRITPHGMRHTFATSLLHRGVSPNEVAEILGHADVATLLNTYAHALPSDRKAALEAIGKAFG
jgi:integrase